MYQFKQFQFNPQLETLKWDDQSRILRPKVAQLLAFFLANPNQLLTREHLLSSLWLHGEYRDAALTQSIQELRKILCDNAQQPEFIKTVPQKGYMWVAPVKSVLLPAEQNNTKFWKIKYSLLVLGFISVIGIAIGSVYYTKQQAPIASSEQQLPRLLVASVENLTGQTQLDWWGYALQQQLKQAAHPYFSVLDEVSFSDQSLLDVMRHNADIGFSAKLTQQQQRYVLHYQINRREQPPQKGQLISEDLHTPINEIVNQLVAILSGHTESVWTESVSDVRQSRQNYLAGLHALTYQGVGAALPYFKAALAHDENNHAAQLELANGLWKVGSWQAALAHFENIDNLEPNSYLFIRYHLYLGRYWLYRGDFAQVEVSLKHAMATAQALNHQRLLARSYQLQADLGWLQLNWQKHSKAMHSAKVLLGAGAFSNSESQRAFYLANPPQAGLEQSAELDMVDNLKVVTKAITYYHQQGQQASLMLSYFALGQNYLATLSVREDALAQALDMAIQQNNQYIKNSILLYMAFYAIQLHQGERALAYLARLSLDEQANAQLLVQQQFLNAMANMDIALSSTMVEQEAWHRATTAFELLLLRSQLDPITRANTQLMLAWLLIAKQDYARALKLITAARLAYKQYELTDSRAFTRYTQMYIQVAQSNYLHAIAMMGVEPEQKLEALYGSYAYAQLGQTDKAFTLLRNTKRQFSRQWQPQDEALADKIAIRLNNGGGRSLTLAQLPPPYSVYCQSEWVLE
ncbi:hypothetical protein PSECIP111854_02525 [Pseudoalteromonas sp. CIP111854]|uniref:OmpR/PhoB-type domain-containing protein n=1 Tax=Pseudoalteromonas holothuriae TaxID=2963714 RepID=A0A9W4W4X2_9GAMM|nr:winged helix-turn-helix domain-containing protein [Pseudoalteromonas sp. CIP111854]CAH9060036.1 hypothetical protein PSECIP111854_02525 [Pseudoalteromonas sp. CIP111854]